MSDARKERIIADLQQAKQTGELKTEKIREIIKNAIAEAVTEVKSGRSEIAELVRDAIAAVTETVKESGEEVKEEVTASIQGVIDGVSAARREKINQTQAEITTLEEFAILQKHYARLKAQTAVLQANLANRYGEQYGEVGKYLEDAKVWYNKAKEDPEVFTEPAKRKRAEFEEKLGSTGAAVARKEKQIKQMLKELWQEIREIFQEKSSK